MPFIAVLLAKNNNEYGCPIGALTALAEVLHHFGTILTALAVVFYHFGTIREPLKRLRNAGWDRAPDSSWFRKDRNSKPHQ